jgi:glutamine amidotransferase
MITLFDYGAGNLHSLRKALELTGSPVRLEADPAACARAELLVLPGVGAFGQAAERLAPARESIAKAIVAGMPAIGICLGMQLLFDASEEGEGRGLGVIAGRVTRVEARRVPHIGWNALEDASDPALASSGLSVPYYANGYACRVENDAVVTAWCTHERDRFPALVRAGRAVGAQFHPEKSGDAGVAFLAALVREATCS